MQFGVHLPHIGPWHDGDTLRRFALAVEEMGYDSVWVSDHIVFPLGFQSRYPYAEGGQFPLPPVVPWLEPVTTLTFVAGATSRVKLGTSILVLPYRNPVLNAKQLGNLQTVSGGRLIVGAGAGWMREEAEGLGLPWDERGARAGEPHPGARGAGAAPRRPPGRRLARLPPDAGRAGGGLAKGAGAGAGGRPRPGRAGA